MSGLVITPAFAGGVVTECSESALRAALAGGGTVTFACDGTISVGGTLVITNDTVLDGNGHQVTLSGGGAVRVLEVNANVRLQLIEVTVAYGGGVNWGAGLLNNGSVWVDRCTFISNQVSGAPGLGGAIYHGSGRMEINGCTFVANLAAGTPGFSGLGGALWSGPFLGSAAAFLGITNSTFYGNGASGGGAIMRGCFQPGGSNNAFLVHSTVANNGGGGVYGTAGCDTLTLINSVLATNLPLNAQGIVDGGYNVSSDSSAAFNTALTHSLNDTDPKLQPLANYGGPTLTMALMPDSPAIDLATSGPCPSTDQRGVSRPYGLGCDSGAFESLYIGEHHGTMRLSASAYTVREDQGHLSVVVHRDNGALGEVAVNLAIGGGTATFSEDYGVTNGVLVFVDGEIQKAFPIPIVADSIGEDAETVHVIMTLADPQQGGVLGTPSEAVVTIYDERRRLGDCTETALQEAIRVGGTVILDCDGTIELTQSLEVAGEVALDATGHEVVLSGHHAVRVFWVGPAASLTLIHVAVVDGLVQGRDGMMSEPGGDAEGAGMYIEGGIVRLWNCLVRGHEALGGQGVPGGVGTIPAPPPGRSGDASGAAVVVRNGQLMASNTVFQANRAQGGRAAFTFTPTGRAGDARGGAVYAFNSVVELVRSMVLSNRAEAGALTTSKTIGGNAFGGGIAAAGGRVRLVESGVWDNHAGAEEAGALFAGSGAGQGGGLYGMGCEWEVSRSEISSNEALGGPGVPVQLLGTPGAPAQGGGIYLSGGSLTISQSTLARNLALGGRAGPGSSGGQGAGGGLFNAGMVIAENVTWSGNRAEGQDAGFGYQGGHGFGGGLYNHTGASAVLIHGTLAGNRVRGGTSQITEAPPSLAQGGAIWNTNGTVRLRNTILAYSGVGNNCFGNVFDDGNNLSSDASCPFTAPGSLAQTDPVLGPLADYGGGVRTMALLSGSPALDTALAEYGLATDARGRPRPYGAGFDIGAFESSAPFSVRGQILGYWNPPGGYTVATGGIAVTPSPNGDYAIFGLAPGPYTVVPAGLKTVFVLSNQVLTLGPDHVDVDFHAFESNALTYYPAVQGKFRAVYAGESGQNIRVQRAPADLASWESIATNTVPASGVVEILEDVVVGGRFYRVLAP